MPPADKDQKLQPPNREQKLAQALRANLRRRKAGGPPKVQTPKLAKSGDEG